MCQFLYGGSFVTRLYIVAFFAPMVPWLNWANLVPGSSHYDYQLPDS